MSKIYWLIIAVIFNLGSISAQSFIGEINPFPSKPSMQLLANDTIKILAVMVNFAEDKDESTFGDGKFGSNYTQTYGNTIIDPLPRDRIFISPQFAQNYYQRFQAENQYFVYNSADTFLFKNYDYSPGAQ
jgi:hypothetical protein